MQTKFIKRAFWGAKGATAALLAGAAQAVPVPCQWTWETTLKGRDIAGNPVNQLSKRAVILYDTELNVTWLRDADVNGLMRWQTARDWADNLAVGAYDDWRLPIIIGTGSPGCNFSCSGTDCGWNHQTKSGAAVYSEAAHLWYSALGNKAYYDIRGQGPQPGWGMTNTGSFENMQPYFYWSGTEYAPDPVYAWDFATSYGKQIRSDKGNDLHALAVRPGDVAAVPGPQTYALLTLGSAGLAVVVRLKRVRGTSRF